MIKVNGFMIDRVLEGQIISIEEDMLIKHEWPDYQDRMAKAGHNPTKEDFIYEWMLVNWAWRE
jgi:hypothetical protein